MKGRFWRSGTFARRQSYFFFFFLLAVVFFSPIKEIDLWPATPEIKDY